MPIFQRLLRLSHRGGNNIVPQFQQMAWDISIRGSPFKSAKINYWHTPCLTKYVTLNNWKSAILSGEAGRGAPHKSPGGNVQMHNAALFFPHPIFTQCHVKMTANKRYPPGHRRMGAT
jgi:hypothetical protein